MRSRNSRALVADESDYLILFGVTHITLRLGPNHGPHNLSRGLVLGT